MTYWNYIYVCLQSDDLNVEYQSCLLSCLVIKDEEVEAEEENNSGYHGYNNVKEWGVVGVVGVLPQ